MKTSLWVGEKAAWICGEQSTVIDKMRDDSKVDKGGGWQCHWKDVDGLRNSLRGKTELSDGLDMRERDC